MKAALILLASVAVAAPANAYEVQRTSFGDPLRWHRTTMELQLDESSVPTDGPIDRTRAALIEAINSWAKALPPPATVEFGNTNGGATPAINSTDRRNTIHWANDNWDDDFDHHALAVTLVTYLPHSGEIVDADIAINAAGYVWTFQVETDCNNAFDLQSVVTHEVGHFFGMAHSPDHPEATMYPSTRPCVANQRELSDDDVEGIGFLYQPEPAYTSPLSCSVSPNRGSGTPSFIVCALLALLASRRSRRLALGVFLLGALGAGGAAATTVARVDMPSLAGSSSVVVRGQVVGQRVFQVGGRVYTDSVIAVSECWRGRCKRSVIVRQLGGEMLGRGTQVVGAGRLALQETVVVFLRTRSDATFSPVGMAQGIFHVIPSDSGQGDVLLRDLRGLDFAHRTPDASQGGVELWRTKELRKRIRK